VFCESEPYRRLRRAGHARRSAVVVYVDSLTERTVMPTYLDLLAASNDPCEPEDEQRIRARDADRPVPQRAPRCYQIRRSNPHRDITALVGVSGPGNRPCPKRLWVSVPAAREIWSSGSWSNGRSSKYRRLCAHPKRGRLVLSRACLRIMMMGRYGPHGFSSTIRKANL
jgi:hypothetical protein